MTLLIIHIFSLKKSFLVSEDRVYQCDILLALIIIIFNNYISIN